MKNIMKEAPKVADTFWSMTAALEEKSAVDQKTKELIIIGMFTADRAMRGIDTHVRRAIEKGATKDEIVSTILFALPVVGISSVTLALEKALTTIADLNHMEEKL